MMRNTALFLAVLATLAGMWYSLEGMFRSISTVGDAAAVQVQLLRAITCFMFAVVFLVGGLIDNRKADEDRELLVKQVDLILRVVREMWNAKKG